MQRVFEALASTPRRKILALLAHSELSAGEIAARFEMTKPSISQHLAVLEAAGLVVSEKRGQFVFYRQVSENLINALHGFVQEVCPVARPLKRESAVLGRKRGKAADEAGRAADEPVDIPGRGSGR
ncbi:MULTISPECIES: metalloregulator ArsR/SmtB family transcription factor [Methylobacterium]|uniref:metalloregulator ArsR/SmtB family transcription factor n=1 Tax=Methylobacterium TaxID=407 RepID=UPI001050AA6E|nr:MULTISPECIES: metalloregulator ArsR/SmtB family transcription factor [Methylobacterium]MDR7036934.1 DNA-binding transcriptional ArsR family regulator [Methylobacterium sp. BE186]